MARRLQVDVETVRRRVSKMESLGVIEGWAIMPNPNLLAKDCVALYFETSDGSKKRNLIENIQNVEGVTSVHSFLGNSLLVFLGYPKEMLPEDQISLVETNCGMRSAMTWSVRFPPSDLAMAPTDWWILRSMRKNPRRRLNEIAQEVGISTRTLNRRMDRLVEGNAFFFEALVNFQKIGRFSFTLLVHCEDEEKKRFVDDLILEKLGSLCEERDTHSSLSNSVFTLFSDNIAKANQTFEWVRSLEVVSDVKMGIQECRILVSSWIDNELEARAPVADSSEPGLKVRGMRAVRPDPISERMPKGNKKIGSWWSGSFVEGRRVKVTLEKELCMGSTSCVEIAPKVFRLDWAKKKSIFDPAPLRILKNRVTDLEMIYLAAQSCPYRAIKLEDADTGEYLFP